MLKTCTTAIVATVMIIACTTFGFAAEKTTKAVKTPPAEEKIEQAFMKLLPDMKVISIAPAQLPGLWEVAFSSKGDKGVVYIDASLKNTFIGSIVEIESGINFTKRKFESINTVDFASISLDNSLVLGDPKAAIKVVVFDDPD